MPSFFVRKKSLAILALTQKCMYCGATDKLTLDHIHPRNKGGDNGLSNLTKACSKCNSYKSIYLIDEFLIRCYEKRKHQLSLFYRYSGRYRNSIRRKTNAHNLEDLKMRFLKARKEHTYFTSVIHSIENKKYIINGH